MSYFKIWQKHSFCFVMVWCGINLAWGQEYRSIEGWTPDVNSQIRTFLNGTLSIKERKVAVFDCDGTLLGQSPYYLADEALYQYAMQTYAGKKDSLSRAKMRVMDALLKGDNVGVDYIKRRIEFLSGMNVDQVQNIGKHMFHEKYESKFYPEMKQLLANLEAYGFEIWVLTASPEILYQQFIHEYLGIPKNRILGVKSVIRDYTLTDTMVEPVPQEQGKAEAIQTFIKTRPILVAGNSRGDLEMMHQSAGLKMIVNPDNTKPLHLQEVNSNPLTLKTYWETRGALIVNCKDVPEGNPRYYSEQLNIRRNTVNEKPVP